MGAVCEVRASSSNSMTVCSHWIWRGIGLQQGNQGSASWPVFSQGWIIAIRQLSQLLFLIHSLLSPLVQQILVLYWGHQKTTSMLSAEYQLLLICSSFSTQLLAIPMGCNSANLGNQTSKASYCLAVDNLVCCSSCRDLLIASCNAPRF